MSEQSGPITHDVMSEVLPGHWEPSIPLPATGLFGWKLRRACRNRGGHFYHPTNRWSVACCQCGHEDDNPNMPKGRYCYDDAMTCPLCRQSVGVKWRRSGIAALVVHWANGNVCPQREAKVS